MSKDKKSSGYIQGMRIINMNAYLDALKKVQSGEVGYIDNDSFYITYTDFIAVDGYSEPVKFPFCCPFHTSVFKSAEEKYSKFPQCCDEHKKLLKQTWFNKDEFAEMPMKVVQSLSYIEYFIKQHLNSPNFIEDVINYLSHCKNSFGQFPKGFGSPLGFEIVYSNLLALIRQDKKIPEDKAEILIKRFEQELLVDKNLTDEEIKIKLDATDLNLLKSTYRKWLNIFPFELSYFSHLKAHYEKQFPVVKPESVQHNPYSGMTGMKLLTVDEFVAFLVTTTESIITEINGLVFHEHNKLPNATQTRLEIINSNRRLQLKEIRDKPTDERRQYIKILKNWFRQEKSYLRELREVLQFVNKSETPSKKELLRGHLLNHGFFDLPSVKLLHHTKKEELLELLSTGGVPYCVAMFDFFGFFKTLLTSYFSSNYKLCKEVSKWLGSDKDGRTVKGNIASLNPKSTEDKHRYTAYLHKEKVEKDYQNLKKGSTPL